MRPSFCLPAPTSTGDVLCAPTVVPLSLCAVLMDGTEQADSLLTVAVQHKLQWCWPGRAGMAAWEGCASKPAVPHPWGGTPRLKVPNSHSLLAADSIRSFPGILSSHCIRKKNKCLNREVSPSPSGREGSFSSCLYP